MRRLTARLAALLSTTVLASTLAVSLAAPAQAAPPVVVDDEITMYANTVAMPDLLLNDSDPDGDDLKVCRLQEVLDGPVMFADLFGFPVLVADVGVQGTFTFRYWVCDYETLVPGTLTVHVKKSPAVKLKITKLKKKPGKLKVANQGTFPLDFAWGHADSPEADRTVRLRKKSTTVISVRRTAITWVAYNEDNGAQKIGYLRGIKLPKKPKPLPPSPRPRLGFTGSLQDALTSGADTSWLSPAQELARK